MSPLDLPFVYLVSPLLRLLKQDRSGRWVRDVERINASDLESIRNHQLKRLRAVCAIAAGTPFYKEKFAAAGIDQPDRITFDDLSRVQPLTREDLRTRQAEIISPSFAKDDLRASKTGGTTSSPITFLMDQECLYHRLAATVAFNRWFGFHPGQKIAYLWGAAQDFPAPDQLSWKGKLRSVLKSRTRVYFSSPLDEATLDRYADDIERFQPSLLQAYPTPLAIFARHLIKRGRQLKIPAISTTAEALLPDQIDPVQKAFGVRPFNWYGSRDCGRVATECSAHDGMHLNSYGLYVEVAPNNTLSDGVGKILITDLWNVGFPLIRYDTQDVGRFSAEECTCGSQLPRLAELSGRDCDVFINSRGDHIPGVSFTGRIIKEFDQIEQMQIKQLALGQFAVSVVPGARFSEDTKASFTALLSTLIGEDLSVQYQIVDEIRQERSGKTRLCINAMMEQ